VSGSGGPVHRSFAINLAEPSLEAASIPGVNLDDLRQTLSDRINEAANSGALRVARILRRSLHRIGEGADVRNNSEHLIDERLPLMQNAENRVGLTSLDQVALPARQICEPLARDRLRFEANNRIGDKAIVQRCVYRLIVGHP